MHKARLKQQKMASQRSLANTELHNQARSPIYNTSSVATVLYHDIFDYPLTKEELLTWSLTARIITRKKISTKDGYLFLAGRHKIINSRESNQQESVYKTAIAVSAYKALSILPTIKFIGITGSLAMNNAKQDSDIDLMIITSPNTLWFYRLMSLLLLDIYGIKRRKAGDRQQKNKVCINIWLDELDLSWPKSKRNI